MVKGEVKFFNDTKNYGFIAPEDGNEDHFVHRSDVESGTLNEGDEVEFESVEGDKGKKAINVEKV